jgi:hypothetical protein
LELPASRVCALAKTARIGRNIYAYAEGDPLNYFDPTGLDVEVCLYPNAANGAGHVGIGAADGSPTSGFYPAHRYPDPRSIHGPGTVRQDDEQGGQCRRLPADQKQDDCVKQCVADRKNNPGTYDLGYRQCTSFVRDCLQQCKINHGNYDGAWPKDFFSGLPQ